MYYQNTQICESEKIRSLISWLFTMNYETVNLLLDQNVIA